MGAPSNYRPMTRFPKLHNAPRRTVLIVSCFKQCFTGLFALVQRVHFVLSGFALHLTSYFWMMCIAGLIWADLAAADIQPYSARYSIYRNGKLTGKAEITFHQQDENWVIESESNGTHGLGLSLGAADSENAVGRILNGHFVPDTYSRHTRLAGMADQWSARFDWDAQSVEITQGNDIRTLDLGQTALDPLSLKLEMRQRLDDPNPDLTFRMVQKDEIDEQNFRILGAVKLETSLGCLATTPVEKVSINGTRFTRVWHAPSLDHVAVRIEHGKMGGNHLEMRITELNLAGNAIVPQPGCWALQSNTGRKDSN